MKAPAKEGSAIDAMVQAETTAIVKAMYRSVVGLVPNAYVNARAESA